MPELAELRLTADYINQYSRNTEGPVIQYCGIAKNPAHKGTHCVTPENPKGYFSLSAESRGKELIVYIHEGDKITPIRMTMGMSGHFMVTNTGEESKHAHLKFYRKDGTTLSFVDVRRFGKWKVGETWSANRGPDPTTESSDFKYNIYKHLDKRAFNQPIHLMLMNQQYFNGIGNYLRAEILYRLPQIDPFMEARSVIEKHSELIEMCTEVPKMAYALGGGQLKDWENPFKNDKEKFEKFIKCYGNGRMAWCKDKNGRRFWFDPKWYDNYLKMIENYPTKK